MTKRVIWKFPVVWGGAREVTIPDGASICSVGYQPGIGMVFWASVDPSTKPVRRTFRIVATGESFNAETYNMYYGTATDQNGLVWHLLEAQT